MAQKKVNYYLRGLQREEIHLECPDDKIAILFKESNPTNKEEVLTKLRKMFVNTEIVKISEKVCRLDYVKSGSPSQVDDDIEIIRKQLPEVIPYYVYKKYNKEGGSLGECYLTNRLIIIFNRGVPDVEIEKIIEKYNLNKIKALDKEEDEEDIVIVEPKPGNLLNPIQIANALESEPVVKDVEPDKVNIFVTTSVATSAANANIRPTDDLFSSQWYLNTQGNQEVHATAHVDALGAWTALGNGGSPEIVVCLIDFGFDIKHPDLVNKIKEPNLDFATPQTPFPTPIGFDQDHGTRCAGIAIAEKNGNGVVGIAYGCTFLPVRCPVDPSDTDLLEIFQKVRHKADVISCSLAPDFRNSEMTRTLSDLIKKIGESEGRRNKGCVICFSAGNFNLPINEQVNNVVFSLGGQEQDPFKGHLRNKYAIHPNVIAVAASSSKNKKAQYSCWGEEISVCAPSSDFEFDPRVIIGPGIVTTAFSGNLEGNKYTDTFGGTSSATSLVAGIAALVLSANPALKASEVKSILEKTADKINIGNATLAGTKGEYDLAGHSQWFGFGKVNAAAAVEEALARVV